MDPPYDPNWTRSAKKESPTEEILLNERSLEREKTSNERDKQDRIDRIDYNEMR